MNSKWTCAVCLMMRWPVSPLPVNVPNIFLGIKKGLPTCPAPLPRENTGEKKHCLCYCLANELPEGMEEERA